MDTRIYEYIFAIAENGNISRAAEQCFLSQPALSRHVSKIEEELGSKLFLRQGNKLELSDAGRIFINNAQAILHIQKKMETKLALMRQEMQGVLRIIVGNEERIFFERIILPRYHREHPDTSLDIIQGEAEASKESLLNGLADLALISTFHIRDDRLDTTTLRRDEYMIAVPADSEIAELIQANGFSFDLLKHKPFVLTKRGCEHHLLEQEVLSGNHFIPQFVCEVEQKRSALHLVRSGFGVAFLPRSYLAAYGVDVTAFSLVPPCRFELIAVYPKTSNKSIQVLLRLTKEAYSNYADLIRESESLPAP